MVEKEKLGLYIHVPFCQRKCPYCGFYSQVPVCSQQMDDYLADLLLEMALYQQESEEAGTGPLVCDSVFIGGGTPSLLSPQHLERLFQGIREAFWITADAEITIEANPDSLSREKLRCYRQLGINRLSMGCQSLDDDLLRHLGRLHDSQGFYKAYTLAQEEGFSNINVDLMFGLPTQSMAQWEKTLEDVLALHPRPTHLSLYSLQLEEGTPYYQAYRRDEMDLPPDEEERQMFHRACQILKEQGYDHYEISNFAQKGKACRHNGKYWTMAPYIGLGAGASSYYQGIRYRDLLEPDVRRRALEERRLPIYQEAEDASDLSFPEERPYGLGEEETRRKLEEKRSTPGIFPALMPETPQEAMGIFCFTALRCERGISYQSFEERFQRPFLEVYPDTQIPYGEWEEKGLLTRTPQGVHLTEKGIDCSNHIMAAFLPQEEKL